MSQLELEIVTEKWATLWPEAAPLFAMHHQEIGDQDLLDVDFELMQKVEDSGALLIVSARGISLGKGVGPLMGYCIFFLSSSLEHRGRLCANQGPWFVLPQARGRAPLLLFRQALRALQLRGVTQVFAHYWPKSDQRLGTFFSRLGGTPTEQVYSIPLKGI